LPQKMSFMSIEPENLILSAFKKSEDRHSYVLRVFNPLDKTIHGKINLSTSFNEVYLLNLNEERKIKLNTDDKNTISICIEHHKIISIEVVV